MDTARGYLEATALGDNGYFGTLELRSPSLIGAPDKNGARANEWRFHIFGDAGSVGIYDCPAGQQQQYNFASIGVGTRAKVQNHYNGALDVAMPLVEQANAPRGDVRVIFRGWADF